MAVPKKKTSSSKRDMRRAHDSIKAVMVSVCSECGKPCLPHNICPFCNTYKGRNIKVVDKA